MGKTLGLLLERATYDRKNDVIWVDATGVEAETHRDVDAVFDPIIAAAKAHPDRYVIACWRDVKIADAEIAAYYGKRSAELLTLCRGILRYAVTDPQTRAHVRTEMIKHRAGGSRLNLYESREEALAAVEELRWRNAPPSTNAPSSSKAPPSSKEPGR